MRPRQEYVFAVILSAFISYALLIKVGLFFLMARMIKCCFFTCGG